MNGMQSESLLKVLVVSEELAHYKNLLLAAQDRFEQVEFCFADDRQDGFEIASMASVLFGDPDRVVGLLPHCGAQLEWIQSSWAGVAPLVKALKGRADGPCLTNVRGIFGPLMAEYVIGHLLNHERRILQRWQSQQQHRWDACAGGGLQGKTLGLLGLGSIGSHVAEVARVFGLRVLGCSRTPPTPGIVDTHFIPADLGTMLTEVDYLFCSLPSTVETRNLLDKTMLSRMRSGAVLINAGRGDLIDDQALVDALQQHLGAAILDVFRQEPLPAEHPFWDTPNLLITSHTAAPSYPNQVAPIFLENLKRYLDGRNLKFQVDLDRGY